MTKPPAFSDLRDAIKKKVTRRELFPAEMNTVVPWGHLVVLVEPRYPKATSKGGCPLMSLEMMLWVYLLQNWYALSDPMAEETLYDSEVMRRFAGVESSDDPTLDETTILDFWYLLERHGLIETILAEVGTDIADKGNTLRSGSLIDATIIDAPYSTKDKTEARDPEMSSTKKRNDWYFDMKVHIGVDTESGVTYSLDTLMAKVQDSQVWDELLYGDDRPVWAENCYVSVEREAAFGERGKVWSVISKAAKLHHTDEDINRIIAMVRAKAEHLLEVLKRQFGYVQTHYRGLTKNRARLFPLSARSNLFFVRRRLLA